MRHIYNYVKAALFAACLLFQSQTEAASPAKLDYVDLGGIHFRVTNKNGTNTLQFRIGAELFDFLKEDYKNEFKEKAEDAGFHDLTEQTDIFLIYLDSTKFYTRTGTGYQMAAGINSELFDLFSASCTGNHSRGKRSLITKEILYNGSNLGNYLHRFICNHVDNGEYCYDGTILSKTDNIATITKNGISRDVNAYIQEEVNAKEITIYCGKEHSRTLRSEKQIRQLVNFSKLFRTLFNIIAALTLPSVRQGGQDQEGNQDDTEGDQGINFYPFADLV